MQLLQLAVRNLVRNLRRTLITLLAIVGGLVAMVLVVVMQAGQHDDMRRSAISSLAGHVVVQAEGYQEEREATLVLGGAEAVRVALAEGWPGATVTRRLWLDGLLTSPTGSVGVALTCADPAAEAAVTTVEEHVIEGAWLEADDTRGVVLGAPLAKQLGVKVGDKVVFMGQYGQEEVQSRLFRVRGLYRSGAAEIDGAIAFAALAPGQELVGVPDSAHQVALHLPGGEDVDQEAATARGRVAAGLDVRTWEEALPELGAMLQVDARSNDVILAVFGVIVAMGVLNTVLMSVMERSRELGVMMALGLRPARLSALVLLEALVLGIVGTTLGMALGCLAAWPMVRDGIDMRAMMGEAYSAGGAVASSVIYGRYDWVRLSGYAVGGVLFTVLAAVWPARMVARLTPLEAMRRV